MTTNAHRASDVGGGHFVVYMQVALVVLVLAPGPCTLSYINCTRPLTGSTLLPPQSDGHSDQGPREMGRRAIGCELSVD